MVVPLSSKKPHQFPGGLSHPARRAVRRGAAEAERMPQPAAVGEIYENGKMTSVKKGAILEVPYIHFINWKPGAKYLPKMYEKPLWHGVDLTQCEAIWRAKRIKIDATGFSSI